MTTTNSSLHDAPQISAKPAPGEKERCVLAYSGGLDTSVCIKWLQEEYGLDVIAVVGDLGQEHEGLEAIKAKALATGAIGCAVIDMRETFANEYLSCAMAANAMYENKYPLVSALSRPLIAKHLVAVAHQFGAKYVAHGCTGKGNDQVRFESSVLMLDPALTIIAPVRNWDLGCRGRRDRLGGGPRRAGEGHHRQALLHRRQPVGPGHRVRRAGRSLVRAAGGHLDHDVRSGLRPPTSPTYVEIELRSGRSLCA